MLQQLARMFVASRGVDIPSAFLRNFHVHDWQDDPNIRLGYTSPTAGALGSRSALAQNHFGTVFFAGEATSTTLDVTVQGSMATGSRAAREVAESLAIECGE